MVHGAYWGSFSVHPEVLKEGMLTFPEQQETATFLVQAGLRSLRQRTVLPTPLLEQRG